MQAMFSQKTMFSLKEMHLTIRSDFHDRQWLQQKGAALIKNGFHEKEWLPLQALFSLQKMFSLNGITFSKKN